MPAVWIITFSAIAALGSVILVIVLQVVTEETENMMAILERDVVGRFLHHPPYKNVQADDNVLTSQGREKQCWLTQRVIIHSNVKCRLLPLPTLCLMQGAELPAEAVSGLPGGAGDPAGVGEWGAASANHKPGCQLLLWPVSVYSMWYFDIRSHLS